jgi:hypothetical protein
MNTIVILLQFELYRLLSNFVLALTNSLPLSDKRMLATTGLPDPFLLLLRDCAVGIAYSNFRMDADKLFPIYYLVLYPSVHLIPSVGILNASSVYRGNVAYFDVD